MTPEEEREKGCTSKRKFISYGGAIFFAKVNKMRAYKCFFCDGWHLTNKNKRSKNDIRLR